MSSMQKRTCSVLSLGLFLVGSVTTAQPSDPCSTSDFAKTIGKKCTNEAVDCATRLILGECISNAVFMLDKCQLSCCPFSCGTSAPDFGPMSAAAPPGVGLPPGATAQVSPPGFVLAAPPTWLEPPVMPPKPTLRPGVFPPAPTPPPTFLPPTFLSPPSPATVLLPPPSPSSSSSSSSSSFSSSGGLNTAIPAANPAGCDTCCPGAGKCNSLLPSQFRGNCCAAGFRCCLSDRSQPLSAMGVYTCCKISGGVNEKCMQASATRNMCMAAVPNRHCGNSSPYLPARPCNSKSLFSSVCGPGYFCDVSGGHKEQLRAGSDGWCCKQPAVEQKQCSTGKSCADCTQKGCVWVDNYRCAEACPLFSSRSCSDTTQSCPEPGRGSCKLRCGKAGWGRTRSQTTQNAAAAVSVAQNAAAAVSVASPYAFSSLSSAPASASAYVFPSPSTSSTSSTSSAYVFPSSSIRRQGGYWSSFPTVAARYVSPSYSYNGQEQCSCDTGCPSFDDCCSDYREQCYMGESLAATAAATPAAQPRVTASAAATTAYPASWGTMYTSSPISAPYAVGSNLGLSFSRPYYFG